MRFFVQVEWKLREFRRSLAPLFYAGKDVYCPFCNREFRKFRPAGRRKFKRFNAVCPACGSRERDRLLYVFLTQRNDVWKSDATLLHIAPEPCLLPTIRKIAGGKYVSCDLFRRDVDVQLNIEALPFPDNSFDAVFCSHVLPEVEHDELALAEIYRVINSSGCALIAVQNREGDTLEVQPGDGNQAPPEFRRIYGSNFRDQLINTGFNVERIELSEVLDSTHRQRLNVSGETAGAIYLVRKT